MWCVLRSSPFHADPTSNFSRFIVPLLRVSSLYSTQSEVQQCHLSAENVSTLALKEKQRRERLLTISDAMRLYLKNKQEELTMIEKEKILYAQGKRHLANIMGFDPDIITEDQISQSIRYLFPTGLFDKKALPVMKPPEEIFPKVKRIDVDSSGSPKNPLFFTVKPTFYSLLSELNKRTQKLMNDNDGRLLKMEKMQTDELTTLGETTAKNRQIILMGTQWVTNEQLQQQLQENISGNEHANFVIALEYISQLPNSADETEFIMSFRREIGASENKRLFSAKIPEVAIGQDGRRECWSICKTRASKVKTVVRDGGTGLYIVNDHHYCTFRSLFARECMLAPIIVAGKLGQVDVEAHLVEGPGGLSVIPRATRQGVALGLAALFPETMERLRLAGLLSTDPRSKERSKINQPGARAKWIWKAR